MQQFSNFNQAMNSATVSIARDGEHFSCPCCGYNTLDSRGHYDVCYLCDWEDDGTDGGHGFGPNHGFSLQNARANFAQHPVVYEPSKDPRFGGPDSELAQAAKRKIIAAFEAIKITGDKDHIVEMLAQINRSVEVLRGETKRKIYEMQATV